MKFFEIGSKCEIHNLQHQKLLDFFAEYNRLPILNKSFGRIGEIIYMIFYFSAEISGNVEPKIRFILNNILRKIEDYLGDNKSYGNEIVGITAIPIIVDDRFSHIKERRYISRKERESDVRLKINYDDFSNGDYDQCCNLVYDNCIRSFNYVYEKSLKRKDGDFYKYYESFIKDFTYYFNLLKNKVTLDQIKKFNEMND